MRERIAKLIDVKSIITILFAVVFGYLSIEGSITPDQFLTVFTVIISFYFGTQAQKRAEEVNHE